MLNVTRNDTILISDVHLSAHSHSQTDKFLKLINQLQQTPPRRLIILGDLFEVYDGTLIKPDSFEDKVLSNLKTLTKNTEVYFMHGNRDFLIDKKILKQNYSISFLEDPSVITIDGTSTLLTHGDIYCTNDRSHQIFIKLTRNELFTTIFKLIPNFIKIKLVDCVRKLSKKKNVTTFKRYGFSKVDANRIKKVAEQNYASIIIHGHTHNPGEFNYAGIKGIVMSSWDDIENIKIIINTELTSF